MEFKAVSKYERVSPRKTRLVARNVVGLYLEEAINILSFTPNKPAALLLSLLKSAYKNAVYLSNDIDEGTMFVKEIIVNEGPSWKRFMPRAQGRATKIQKRTSHISVILAEGQD